MRAADALALIERSTPPLSTVTLSLGRSVGLVLAEPVVATEDIPPFDNSAMDGYAVRAADTSPPGLLRIAGEIPAGSELPGPLKPGESAAIMTGGRIPAGADAVVPVEMTEKRAPGQVAILEAVKPGSHVRAAGADARRGSVVAAAGRRIRPYDLGLIASAGVEFVRVRRRPEVNLLPTGSELVAAGSGRAGAKIRDSNSHVVASLLEQSGCRVVRFPITGDDEAELAAAIGRGLAGDMLITIGGVSAGAYDLVPGVLRKLGVEVRFHKLKIKPGGPILFGTRGSTIVFSLPGNPVSAAVTFGQFVAPAIAAMTGASAEPLRLTARLEHDVSKSDGKMHFMRGILGRSGATFTVRSAGAQSSNMISTLAASDCLVVLPEERSKFKTDEEVEVRLL